MKTITETLHERQQTHGDFSTHAEISQSLLDVCQRYGYRQNLSAIQKESLEMICHKIARILNGNPDYHDHWLDIGGYAQLVADRLRHD